MMTSKTLKLISLGLSVLGAVVGVAGSLISDKRQSLEMNECINNVVEQKFTEMSIPETAIKES